MAFKTIIQPVVVSTGTYSSDQILFDAVELQLPAQSVRLVSGFFIVDDTSTADLNEDECAIHFFQKTATSDRTYFGAAGSSCNSADNFPNNVRRREMGWMASLQISNKEVEGVNGNQVGFHSPQVYHIAHIGEQGVDGAEFPLMEDTTVTSINPGHTVFMVGTIDGISTSPSFPATDSCRIILTFEY
mgnify:CR=1 FL=1